MKSATASRTGSKSKRGKIDNRGLDQETRVMLRCMVNAERLPAKEIIRMALRDRFRQQWPFTGRAK